MKKLLIPALLVIIILSSCGGETPTPSPSTSSKKISEIYYEFEEHNYISNDNGQTWNEYDSEYTDKELRERWTWDGDKLYSIENYSQFIYDDLSLNFTYENGLVSEIVAPAINERIICYYDNDKLSRIYFTSDNKSSEAWDFVYSGNKIIRIDKVDIPEYFTITWDGNNISMIKCFGSDVCIIEASYTYDNKHNPYHGSDALLALAIIKADFALMSSNNMTSKRINDLFPILDPDGDYYTYTYQYTNNYPTLKTQIEEVVLQHPELDYLSKHISEKRYYINYLED